jgi:acetoin utilization deacetylase AcuC-like enzyme
LEIIKSTSSMSEMVPHPYSMKILLFWLFPFTAIPITTIHFTAVFTMNEAPERARGGALHLPLLPGTTWKEYGPDLDTALQTISEFGTQAFMLSMGLDTHEGDPCAVRRAGFRLSGVDYLEMGRRIGAACGGGGGGGGVKIPTVVIQEGSYRMDKVPGVAADVLCGYTETAAVSP